MSKRTYSDLLKDPRWQRMRLEVLNRQDFTCEECGSKDRTLHVHHTYYTKNTKPWEYPASSLRVLCEQCHEAWQALMTDIQKAIGQLYQGDQLDLLGVAIGMQMSSAMAVRFRVEHDLMLWGIARMFGTNAGFLRDLVASDKTICGDDVVAALVKAGAI